MHRLPPQRSRAPSEGPTSTCLSAWLPTSLVTSDPQTAVGLDCGGSTSDSSAFVFCVLVLPPEPTIQGITKNTVTNAAHSAEGTVPAFLVLSSLGRSLGSGTQRHALTRMPGWGFCLFSLRLCLSYCSGSWRSQKDTHGAPSASVRSACPPFGTHTQLQTHFLYLFPPQPHIHVLVFLISF